MVTAFDPYAATYQEEIRRAVNFVPQAEEFYTVVKAEHLLGQLRRLVGKTDGLRILDVGCGNGRADRHLVGRVGELCGVDVCEAMVERARKANPDCSYQVYDDGRLPYDDGFFDVAFTICVMHHVPPKDWPRFVAEMRRVVRPGGLVVVYEHNPYNPLTRLAVARCSFDRDAVLLSCRKVRRLFREGGLDIVEASYLLFVPMRGRLVRMIEAKLGWLPLGAQYMVMGKK